MMPRVAKASCWLLVIALLGAVGGCSWFSKKTGNEPMELVDFEPSVKLRKAWSRSIGEGQGAGFTSLTPALDGDKIYAVDHQGLLVAMKAENGKKLWSRKINKP